MDLKGYKFLFTTSHFTNSLPLTRRVALGEIKWLWHSLDTSLRSSAFERLALLKYLVKVLLCRASLTPKLELLGLRHLLLNRNRFRPLSRRRGAINFREITHRLLFHFLLLLALLADPLHLNLL